MPCQVLAPLLRLAGSDLRRRRNGSCNSTCKVPCHCMSRARQSFRWTRDQGGISSTCCWARAIIGCSPTFAVASTCAQLPMDVMGLRAQVGELNLQIQNLQALQAAGASCRTELDVARARCVPHSHLTDAGSCGRYMSMSYACRQSCAVELARKRPGLQLTQLLKRCSQIWPRRADSQWQ